MMNEGLDTHDKSLEEFKRAKARALSVLIKNTLGFEMFLFFIMGVAVYIFFILNNNSFEGYEIPFYLFWYPLSFFVIIVWIKVIKKEKTKKYLLEKPKWPKKHHRWFYIAYTIFFFVIIVGWLIFLKLGTNYAVFRDIDLSLIILGYIHSCVGAPIVEEIIFRGYWHEEAKKVWGKDGWYLEWKKKFFLNNTNKIIEYKIIEKPIMKFQITYAAIFSSFLFGIWHLNIIQSIYTFFGGLIFVKTKREWGNTLIAPMILHASWNFLAQILIITEFPIFDTILDLMKTLI
ncbi:MAG: lysostaphin resistance A-like protein [Promethearchaeota archaeon]